MGTRPDLNKDMTNWANERRYIIPLGALQKTSRTLPGDTARAYAPELVFSGGIITHENILQHHAPRILPIHLARDIPRAFYYYLRGAPRISASAHLLSFHRHPTATPQEHGLH